MREPVPRIGWIAGKPPRRSPVIATAIKHVQRCGYRVQVATHDEARPAWASTVDLLVLRGVGTDTLRCFLRWDEGQRAQGDAVRFLHHPQDLLAVADRGGVYRQLAAAQICVPRYQRATSWQQVKTFAHEYPSVVVKHADGSVGRAARVRTYPSHTLPIDAPFRGPFVVEAAVSSEVTKLYRIGRRVVAMRQGDPHVPTQLTAAHEALAHRTAQACRLSILGIDVIDHVDGPVVIDVNPFPSATLVTGSARSMAAHITRVLRTPEDTAADISPDRTSGAAEPTARR